MTMTRSVPDAATQVSMPQSEADAAAITALLEAVRMRDPSLADHGIRVAHIAAAIAQQLGASEQETSQVYLGAILHDIGKLGIPESILWKPTGLAASEWAAMRTHPQLGHQLVADIVDGEVAAVVLYHHERYDGTGYPFGVAIESVPTAVRVVQVADAYDALTSDRPYEAAVSTAAALAEIDRCSGSQFHPEAVGALTSVLGSLDQPDLASSAAATPLPADPFA